MTDQPAQLKLALNPEDASDVERTADLTQQLRQELLQLDVRVDPWLSGDAPEGTRGGQEVVAGGLIVSAILSPGVLQALIATMRDWLARLGGHSVRIELDDDVIELGHVTSRQQQDLVEAWITRHAAARGS